MRTRKKKADPLPEVGSYRPPGQDPPEVVELMPGWNIVHVTHNYEGVPHAFTYVLDPERKVFRFAQDWENPSVIFRHAILSVNHDIRLVRIKDKDMRLFVRQQLKILLRRRKRAVRGD